MYISLIHTLHLVILQHYVIVFFFFFFFNDPPPPEISPLPHHAALPIPPIAPLAVGLERPPGAVRRLGLEDLLEPVHGTPRVARGRDPERELQGRRRTQHVAAVGRQREPRGSGDREGGAPGAAQDQLAGVHAHGPHAGGERGAGADL